MGQGQSQAAATSGSAPKGRIPLPLLKIPITLLSYFRKPGVILLGGLYCIAGSILTVSCSNYYQIVKSNATKLRNRIAASILLIASAAAPYCGFTTMVLGVAFKAKDMHMALLPVLIDAAAFIGTVSLGLTREGEAGDGDVRKGNIADGKLK